MDRIEAARTIRDPFGHIGLFASNWIVMNMSHYDSGGRALGGVGRTRVYEQSTCGMLRC